jgi:mono/diheme cytochrome c family protein
LGGERKELYLGGGEAEGWHATAINASSPAPVGWTVDQLTRYLRQGWDDEHGHAAGPMSPVVHELAEVTEADVRAMATYLVAIMGKKGAAATQTVAPSPDESRVQSGAAIFVGACASCHDEAGSAVSSIRTVPLAQTTSIHAPDPRNVLHIVLEGIWPEPGEKGVLMPGFKGALTEDQLASLLAYLRVHFARSQPWPDVSRQVREIVQRQDRDGND